MLLRASALGAGFDAEAEATGPPPSGRKYDVSRMLVSRRVSRRASCRGRAGGDWERLTRCEGRWLRPSSRLLSGLCVLEGRPRSDADIAGWREKKDVGRKVKRKEREGEKRKGRKVKGGMLDGMLDGMGDSKAAPAVCGTPLLDETFAVLVVLDRSCLLSECLQRSSSHYDSHHPIEGPPLLSALLLILAPTASPVSARPGPAVLLVGLAVSAQQEWCVCCM